MNTSDYEMKIMASYQLTPNLTRETINYNFILAPFQRFNVSTLEKLESIFPSENKKDLLNTTMFQFKKRLALQLQLVNCFHKEGFVILFSKQYQTPI